MPTKYKPKPVEAHKIDYGTAKSHWMNLRFKNGLPSVAGGDIKKGTSSYNEVVHLQQTLKEKDFVLLLAELADTSPTHWNMAAKYWEKRGWEVQIAGEVLADAKQFYTNEPPVSVIVQETKELSPAPISVVIKETKKPEEVTVESEIKTVKRLTENQFKKLSLDEMVKHIEDVMDEMGAIVNKRYGERNSREWNIEMDYYLEDIEKYISTMDNIQMEARGL